MTDISKEQLLAAFRAGHLPKASDWQFLIVRLYDTYAETTDIGNKHSEVVSLHSSVTVLKQSINEQEANITTKHGEVDQDQQTVASDKAIVLSARQDVEDRQAVVVAKEVAFSSAAAQALNDVNTAGSTQTGLVTSEGTAQVSRVKAESDSQVNRVQTEGFLQIQAATQQASLAEQNKNLASGAAQTATEQAALSAQHAQSIGPDKITQLQAQGSRKNLLINGNFLINQRTFDGNWSSLSNGTYGYDRWKKHPSGIEQIIEGGWFLTGTYIVSWQGTGSALIDGNTVNNGGTFEVTDNNQNISVVVPEDALYVQVEKGSEVTDFNVEFIGSELVLCQRYFQKIDYENSIYGYSFATMGSNERYRLLHLQFPVTMRTTPTMTVYGAPPESSDINVTVDGGRVMWRDSSPSSIGSLITGWEASAEL